MRRPFILRYSPRALLLLLVALAPLWPVTAARAEGEGIGVISSSVTSEFPDGFRIRVQASGGERIDSIAIRLRVGQQTSGVYNYLEMGKGEIVDAELFWRTRTAGAYIPPGTIISYIIEVEDLEGNVVATEPEEFIYHDARFDWQEVSDGPVAVAYHGPVRTRAETILQTILDTMDTMGPVLGADIFAPIRVTMYNNVKEMLEALPPRSATVGRELITEGQAFNDIGTLLVLGGGRLSTGTASHEVTHILTHRAGSSVFRGIPSWLSEGLSEYGNVDPGYSYDIALEFAIETDRLLPVAFMNVLPGKPEDVIIFYGQARSIVRYMIGVFGPSKMKELMATMKSGVNVDDALQAVYGFDRLELDAQWRRAIRAPSYVPPESGRSRPTPIPLPTVGLYTLTPQADTSGIGDQSDPSTPTVTPEPTATPEPTPTEVTVAIASEDTGASQQTTEPAGEERPEPVPGGGCNGPIRGAGRTTEASFIGLLAMIAWLGFRRVRGR